MFEAVFRDLLLMLLCYAYIVAAIKFSSSVEKWFSLHKSASRKLLHMMIGNLPFVIPFFSSSIYPVMVAAPFILVTLLASPYSHVKASRDRLKQLAEITGEGRHLGLIFYSVSYTVLACFFSAKPYIVAAGILPMAYGDSTASLVGGKWGKRRYRIASDKSLEGSAAMFLASLAVLTVSLAYFAFLYSFSFVDRILPTLIVALLATVAEGVSPGDLDNLVVPNLSALAFLYLTGGG